MEIELDPGVGTSKEETPVQLWDDKDSYDQSVRKYVETLVHACRCKETSSCKRVSSCNKLKKVVKHTKVCKKKTKGDCGVCKQLIAVCCYHAKNCQEEKCSVPFCKNIRSKFNFTGMPDDNMQQMSNELCSTTLAAFAAFQSKE